MTSVLIVEDDQMLAKAVGQDLSEHGFAVSIVDGVAAALEALAASSVDVLLTDLQLGPQDGIDLLDSLRRVSPRTRAVLMSGFATARDYQRAIELGAIRVLCKPFTPSELIQCISQAVECETGFRGSVHGLSLVDMLQMYNYGRRSVTITVATAGRAAGLLHMGEGQLVHVEHDGLVGEPALAAVLALAAGSLSTSAYRAPATRTIERDFREVLLDALRVVDEAQQADVDKVDLMFDEVTADLPPEKPSVSSQMLERVRRIDGYLASCVALESNGGVLGHDGVLDLRSVAPLTAAAIRGSGQSVADLRLDDRTEELLITYPSQLHLVRPLRSELPTFVHVVLDCRQTSPAMAQRALADVVRSLAL